MCNEDDDACYPGCPVGGGIRHWTATDGTFHFRVASPRVSVGEKDTKLQYKVRVFEATPNGNGPETTVMCEMAPPTE